jgi:hypothetical protein
MKRDGQRVSTLIVGLQVDGCKRRTTGCDNLGWWLWVLIGLALS